MGKRNCAHQSDEHTHGQEYSVVSSDGSVKDFAAFAAYFDDVIPDFAGGEVKAAVVGGEAVLAGFLLKQFVELSQVDPASLISAAITGRAGFIAHIWLAVAPPGFTDGQICFTLAAIARDEDMDFEGHESSP